MYILIVVLWWRDRQQVAARWTGAGRRGLNGSLNRAVDQQVACNHNKENIFAMNKITADYNHYKVDCCKQHVLHTY